VTVFMTAHLG